MLESMWQNIDLLNGATKDPELLEQAAQRWDWLVANGIYGDEAKRQVDDWLTQQ